MPILRQIVSGGQTGADRAALDTAIKFNIPHGGWLPKGRVTESGPLPEVYRLQALDTADYPARTRQNVLDSNGTVIIARGALTGGSKLTQSFARTARKPSCHIDLLDHDIFEAAIILQSFVLENQVRILNVAGPRASHDPAIYHDVKSIVEAALYLFFLESDFPETEAPPYPELPPELPFPKNLEEALELMEADLDLKAKSWMARLDNARMAQIYFHWLDPVRQRLGFDIDNPDLLADLRQQVIWEAYAPEDAVMDILKALKTRLSLTHDLRLLS